jgi:hypothetical protein
VFSFSLAAGSASRFPPLDTTRKAPMFIADIDWHPDWPLVVACIAAILLIYQGSRNYFRLRRLEEKLDALDRKEPKSDSGG